MCVAREKLFSNGVTTTFLKESIWHDIEVFFSKPEFTQTSAHRLSNAILVTLPCSLLKGFGHITHHPDQETHVDHKCRPEV